jgi:hypothetical protein
MNAIVEDKLAELREICARRRVKRLELFGSAARSDRLAPGARDLDFLVEYQPLELAEYADAYFGLLFDLERLFDRPVDLVMPSAIRNRYFREAIDKDRLTLYAA